MTNLLKTTLLASEQGRLSYAITWKSLPRSAADTGASLLGNAYPVAVTVAALLALCVHTKRI
jgi:hypothetical protein